MVNFYIDTEAVKAVADEISKVINEIEYIMRSVEKNVLSLPEFWKGSAACEYVANITNSCRQYEQFETVFREFSSILSEVASDFESTDMKLKYNLSGGQYGI